MLIPIALAVFALTAVSCKTLPGAQSPEVVVVKESSGAAVVRLARDDQHDTWKLKDEKYDILIRRREGGFFDVNVSVTSPNGGKRRVSTKVKASPGQRIPLGGLGDLRMSIEFPHTKNVYLLSTRSTDRTTAYKFEITRSKFDSLLEWTPNSKTIPLQPQRAAHLALQRYRSLYPSATTVFVLNFTLTPLQGTHGKKWMYWVSFSASEDGSVELPATAAGCLVVLFDGSVVDPEVDPAAGGGSLP